MKINTAIIGVGSNISPKENIKKAKEILKKEQTFLSQSKFIKTKSQGFSNQPDFLNGAFYIKTKLKKELLEKYLKKIEKRLGRTRTSNKNISRTIDLDIIVFNEITVDDDFFKYSFVKKSVLEIIPELTDIG